MVTGTIGVGDWRIRETQRLPRHNQARRQATVALATGGKVDLAKVAKKSGGRAKPITKQSRNARKRARRTIGRMH